MDKLIDWVLLPIVAVVFYALLPSAMVWAWMRWWRNSQNRTVCSFLSLVGLGLATSSAILMIVTTIYAHQIGGFPFYDPLLLRIYRWGGLLSSAGIVFGVGGVWRPNPLRWLTPACALGMFLLWGMLAMGE